MFTYDPPKKWLNKDIYISRVSTNRQADLCYRSSIITAGIACWYSARLITEKVASSNPSRSSGRIFFSRVNFACWLLFCVHSTPLLLQWHIKGPGHSAKSASGRLHLNRHAPLTQQSQSGLIMPPSIAWEPIRKRAHTQLVREHSVTVVSAR